jgi:hypothetical protein
LVRRFADRKLVLLRRHLSLVYLLINVLVAVGVLWILRYSSEPNSRTAELEQIALAGFSSRAVLRALGHRATPGKQHAGASETKVKTSRDSGDVLDDLLNKIVRDLDTDLHRRELQVAAALSGVSFPQLYVTIKSLLIANVLEQIAEDKRAMIEGSLVRIDNVSLQDEHAARDAFVLLCIEVAGEKWLRSGLIVYQRRWKDLSPPALRLAVPWWRWRLRRELGGRPSTSA